MIVLRALQPFERVLRLRRFVAGRKGKRNASSASLLVRGLFGVVAIPACDRESSPSSAAPGIQAAMNPNSVEVDEVADAHRIQRLRMGQIQRERALELSRYGATSPGNCLVRL